MISISWRIDSDQERGGSSPPSGQLEQAIVLGPRLHLVTLPALGRTWTPSIMLSTSMLDTEISWPSYFVLVSAACSDSHDRGKGDPTGGSPVPCTTLPGRLACRTAVLTAVPCR